MKTTYLLLTFCVLAFSGNAQYNGMTVYSHAGSPSVLSSGNLTRVHNNGFLLGGYDPNTVITGGYNLFIDKTGPRGLFGAVNSFRKRYLVDLNAPCIGTSTQLFNCHGLSVIETSTISCPYMMTATFDEGFVISALDMTGNVIAPSYFFTYTATATAPSRPFITESAINPNHYYITNSYLNLATNIREFVVVLVDGLGTVLWSYIYNLGTTNSSMEPTAIIESPLSTSPEIVIVGVTQTSFPSVGRKGFFVTISGDPVTGGTIGQSRLIGSPSGSNEEFHSLAGVPGMGYLIGGYTDNTLAPGSSWMLMLDVSFSPPIVSWSSQISPGAPGGDGPVVGVLHRNSPTFGNQFYGVSRSSIGSVVSKLESGGLPFSGSPNEFLYNPSDPAISEPVAITHINTNSINQGIHVYGTDRTPLSPERFYLVNAFYNGTAGTCSNSGPVLQFMNNMSGVTPGPTVVVNAQVSRYSGPVNCIHHTITDNTLALPGTALCPFIGNPGSPYTGSNARPAVTTGIPQQSLNAGQISIQPNPVQETLTLRYTLSSQQPVKIEIFNALGQRVKAFDQPSQAGENQMNIDFSTLDVESGIYFIHTSIGQNTDKQKVIYQK
jgi:hypothetical protein